MVWFKRKDRKVITETKDKKEIPEGLWYKCPKCKIVVSSDEHIKSLWVCQKCNHHERINAMEYFSFLFDEGKFIEMDKNIFSIDPLNFSDTKKYTERLQTNIEKTKLNEAVTTAHGEMNNFKVTLACMNFNFIGGSMGSVVGEKISRAIDFCIKKKQPFIMISKSGGARMMESAYSLMQMGKTSAKLSELSQCNIPYISVLTDPTTGGITASFAMLGDINIAEPKALIGFAGPRVVKETIGKELPKNFQTSEFLLDHGFLDFIVERKFLKTKISKFLEYTFYK
ncbi:MAG: acetyl-CoA carboxylase carboxyltransferase subunit beta [Flavobacteriales bacterium TMED288]|nr:acetyl-CoA carboxylase carboxyl transferase subunit beta [Flavobacteriales bacterium]RPG52771.1 MAG: acetyl-CoA carboxylase carboxyltransferase subunit beta [Flavobacteriales bacterium TMED288]|tara:strand:- start:512 stop:1360 length:849 start_codon:yes stop_codon:yes gene_type:complete